MNEIFSAIVLLVLIVALLGLMIDLDKIPDGPPTTTNIENSHALKHQSKDLYNQKLILNRPPKHNFSVVPDQKKSHSLALDVKKVKRLFVLTTGERSFLEPRGYTVEKVHGLPHENTVANTYDEGFGPKQWPVGARHVADGHVTIWKRIAAECPDWCFVSEDDAIWPDLPLPDMPEDGFVSFFGEAVCDAATQYYSDDYKRVVRAVVRGRCMPYGAVAYALSGSFAKTLLNALPMDKPVDHFLWEQAVKHNTGFVARNFGVKHARGKSLRESVVKSHDDSEYIMYKDVDQIGFDIGGAPIVSAREFCSKRRDCMAYNHMGWAKSSLNHVQSVRGVHLYVKRKHALSSFRAGVAEEQPPVHTNCDFEMNEPVDVVYTWVNWTAPAYVAQMRKHGILYGEHKESHMNYEKTSDDSSYEELRYSMSSLLKHGGNIGKIYVVINPIHGPPAWLDTSHPNVEIVHHSKILPNVPTNNAWAIATAIHRIPGLRKWFLALNDDVILNKNLEINSRLIQCPRSELQYSHCPTLRNTCLMRALEKHFEARVQKVFDYRKKSTTSYRPDVVLWLEHHNWMVANGHATYEPDSNWFGLVNTNAWRKDSNWVNRRWGQVLKKAERSMWINFQGQGISWEYPENEAIRRQYNSWIAVRGYDKHFAAMRESAKVQGLEHKHEEKTKKHVLLKDMSLVQKRAPKWKRFPGYDADPEESMGYTNHVAPLADIQVDAERLGASGFTVINGRVWFHRNVGKKHAKSGVVLWVNTAADPRPRYGCSRHAHACSGSPEMGSAPCCTEVMKLIMEDMTSQLRKHNVHWRIASGQMLSILRDGVLSMFDHDFDPIFEAGKQEEAIRIIAETMHLSGKPSKWRDADYYYTGLLAAKVRTNWSKYEVIGGDFNWENPKFHSKYALQQNPTFIDIGQAQGTPPREGNTFRCSPAFDVLCLRDWYLEASHVFGGGITRRPSWISNDQWRYAGYDRRIERAKGAMYNGMALTSHSERDEIARQRVKEYPNYWKRTAKQEETHHVIYNTTKSHVQHTAHVIPVQKRAVQMSNTEEGWSSDICTPLYFLGGGKAGSTTLAMLLKHGAPSYATWDPNGQFADSGKEVCWAESGSTSRGYWRHFQGCTTSKRKLFALDACPRYYSDTHLSRIARVHPNAKFIMLVREPANRIVSHLNDHALRYGVSFEFESRFKQVIQGKHSLEWELSQYSKMLQTFLKYFDSNQILIVKTEDLNAYTKEIVSEIMKHIGGTNKEITPIESNRLNKRSGYRRPSSSALQHARDIMRPGVEWLREHTDIHIGWSSFGVKQKTNPLVRHIGGLSSKKIDLYPDDFDGAQSVKPEMARPKKLTCDDWKPLTNTKWAINRCSDKPFNMAVHSIPDIVSLSFIKTGCWEKHILKRVVDHMKTLTSGLFFDVGANIGAFTATVANNGHEVIAVEPFYMNIPIIQSTVCQQHMEKVHLYKVGVSDTSPGQKMCIWSTNSQINNGNARMTPYFEGRKDFGQDKQKECMEVIYTYTLDELLFDVFKLNRPIDAMKIDIEGLETRAFRGAKRLLASPLKPRKIWFEYQKQATIESGVPQYELFEVLAAAGYDVIDFTKSSVALRAPHWGHINIGDFEATLREVPNNDYVAVAVPVYNRIGYAKLCATALKGSISSEHVYVFDDHSTEFSVDDLKKWFSTSNVRRNEVRLKADKQARAIMEWFVETEYDWLVTLDSDLIVRPDWLTIFEKHVSQTQGVVSLYHSGNIKNHPTGACADGLCEMRSLGNAGVAWSKPLAKRMLASMQNRDGFDWGWTEWLQKQGVPQYAFEKSLALHIGMHGTWGVDSTRELSLGFDTSTLSEEIRMRASQYLNGIDP